MSAISLHCLPLFFVADVYIPYDKYTVSLNALRDCTTLFVKRKWTRLQINLVVKHCVV